MIEDVFDRIDLLSSVNRKINKITFLCDIFMFQKTTFFVEVLITINPIEDYCAVLNCIPNMKLTLKKDYENPYDDEAIAAYRNGSKVGYIANSVSTVCRGTYSAGRIYDRFDKEAECVVRFVSVEYGFLIAEIDCG